MEFFICTMVCVSQSETPGLFDLSSSEQSAGDRFSVYYTYVLWTGMAFVLLMSGVTALLKLVDDEKKGRCVLRLEEHFAEFFAGLKAKTLGCNAFYIFFVLRRALIVLVAIYLPEMPLFQFKALMLMSFFFMVYLIHERPYEWDEENRLQVYNESVVYMACFHSLLLLQVPKDPVILLQIGWSLILFVVINIAFNMVRLLYYARNSMRASYRVHLLNISAWDDNKNRQCSCKCYHCGGGRNLKVVDISSTKVLEFSITPIVCE